MTDKDKKLAHLLKLRFGLSTYEPNEYQLSGIKQDISNLYYAKGQNITIEEWAVIVKKWCPSYQTNYYLGVDNSDINTLLMLATNIEDD